MNKPNTTDTSWFSIDKAGLRALLDAGKHTAILELIQNSFDEDGVTQVLIELTQLTKTTARLFVSDNSTNGYADLRHAFTLFAPSTKLGDAEKRGRFNLGEKLVLALCEWAEIVTTTGGFRFDSNGRSELARTTGNGSTFEAEIHMTADEVKATIEQVHRVIPPDGVKVTLNGTAVLQRTNVHSFKTTLPTVLADAEGRLRPTSRKTEVLLYEPQTGETPTIFEMGIPVVEDKGAKYHVSVQQKVPLSMTRDNVTPTYLKTLHTAVLNETINMLTEDDTSETWVKEAMQDKNIKPEVAKEAFEKMYGKGAVIFDPTNHEANRRAAEEGRQVVGGRAFKNWDVLKSAGVQSAGKVFPKPADMGTVTGHAPFTRTSPEMTPKMGLVLDYAERFAKNVLGVEVTANIYPHIDTTDASGDSHVRYGGRKLNFNLEVLGRQYFESPSQERLDADLIHAFAHEKAYSHNSREFWDECCRIGARAKTFAKDIGSITDATNALRDLERNLRENQP